MTSFELDDFDDEPLAPFLPEPVAAPMSEEQIETARVAGYEAGYKSGWDDAVRNAEEDARNVGAELARNLRDLNFTYFEAREEVLATLRPFLTELLDAFFPALLPEAVGAAIAQDLSERLKESCTGKLRISVSPDDVGVVTAILSDYPEADAEILAEPALAPGQARITSERNDLSIDAEAALDRLRAALDGAHVEEGMAYGT